MGTTRVTTRTRTTIITPITTTRAITPRTRCTFPIQCTTRHISRTPTATVQVSATLTLEVVVIIMTTAITDTVDITWASAVGTTDCLGFSTTSSRFFTTCYSISAPNSFAISSWR